MNQRQHHAAPQVGPGTVALAMILPGMPVGQVLAPFGPRAEHLAQRPARSCSRRLTKQRMKAELTADHRGQTAAVPPESASSLAIVERMRQRLFDEQVAAGLGGGASATSRCLALGLDTTANRGRCAKASCRFEVDGQALGFRVGHGRLIRAIEHEFASNPERADC